MHGRKSFRSTKLMDFPPKRSGKLPNHTSARARGCCGCLREIAVEIRCLAFALSAMSLLKWSRKAIFAPIRQRDTNKSGRRLRSSAVPRFPQRIRVAHSKEARVERVSPPAGSLELFRSETCFPSRAKFEEYLEQPFQSLQVSRFSHPNSTAHHTDPFAAEYYSLRGWPSQKSFVSSHSFG